ncbi:MAG: 3-oxoadipyl-CoA thiolase [Opitutus sp.]|nr:3-oxoadipyl-CoA thiolase [Opitutus sp.]
MREVFLCDGVRTPIGRFNGALAAVRTDDLAALPIKALLARHASLDWAALDEVVLGCANQAGEDNRNVARMAVLLSGLPVEVPAVTVNRLCASGMEAVAMAARAIRTGEVELVIAGGVESMTRAPVVLPKVNGKFDPTAEYFDTTIGWRFVNPVIREKFGTDSMPETAENLATERGIARADQDAYALRSHQRAVAARGFLAGEIVPVPLANGTMVTQDEHPRADTSLEKLASLKTPFRTPGTITAGNASGVNDGACALLLASADAVKRYGLRPIARLLGSASAGVAPRVMGIGPVPATRKLLVRLDLTLAQMDNVELNEAFAAQVLAVTREFGLPDDAAHVNPNGGAIALGHPLGMTGARLVLTGAREMQRRGGKFALCTLCVGVGQGQAMVLGAV